MDDDATLKLTATQRLAVETVGRDVLVTAQQVPTRHFALSRRCIGRLRPKSSGECGPAVGTDLYRRRS